MGVGWFPLSVKQTRHGGSQPGSTALLELLELISTMLSLVAASCHRN